MTTDGLKNIGRVGFLLIMVLIGISAFAQNANTGEIKGGVTDPSGAFVSDVAVSLMNVQTGVVTTAKTNQSGLYDVPFLAPGSYKVKFSKQGFKDFVREGIVLQVETLQVSGTLQVGAATEEVVVSGAPPLVETETTDQHVNLDTQAIVNAPITGTDWRTEMTQLIPGVNPGLYGGSQAGGQGIGINGTQAFNMNFMMDGSAATAPRDYNSSNFYMPLDSMSEVSIHSSNAPAQYGNGLAAINVITKSGTNSWHGDLFLYDQNTVFNARSVFNRAPSPKSVEHWNEYGGSIGGPVLKNKLFLFFTYQRNPAATPATGTYSYPTAAMQAGNFYGINGSTGSAFDSAGILQGTYSTVAQNMQTYFPGANAPGWIAGCPGPVNPGPGVTQTCSSIDNYVFSGTASNKATWYTGRVDYNVSTAQKLSFTFNYYPTVVSFVPPDPLYPNAASAFSQGNNYNLTGQLSYVYTITPTVLNEFRIGAARELDKYKPWSLGKGVPTSLGLEPAYGTNVPPNADLFPHISIDPQGGLGGTALGAGSGNGNIDAVLGDGTYNVSDVLTLIHGRHTLKIGGEYDRHYQNYTSWGDLDSGHFEFSGAYTGIPYADFLAGDVYSWHVGQTVPTSIQAWTSALFVHDDYRVSSNVTLNLGLRWQMVSGWGVKNNLFGIFDPKLPNSWNGGQFPGAILFGGQSDKAYGVSNLHAIENGYYKEFAPRVGVAWAFRPSWVFRASYGLFDAPRDADIYGGGNGGTLGLGLNPTSPYLGFSNSSPAFQLDSGPPAGSVQYPTLQTATPEVANGTYIAFYPRNIPRTYVQQLLTGVQHQLQAGILLDASYVYTHATNLNYTTNVDAVTASNLGCSSGWWVCNPNPNFPYIAGMNFTGWSNYNALQLRVQKRMSSGLQFQANYAFSKSLDTGTSRGWGSGGVDVYQDPYSPASNYAPSATDIRHFVVGQVVYELPFGSDRQYKLHGVLNAIAGGWRVSTIAQWHTGLPFTPQISHTQAFTGSGALDPGLSTCWSCTLYAVKVGDPYAGGHNTPQNNTPAQWFNPAAYTNPTAGTFGQNLRDSLYGPHFLNMDFGIGKIFSVTERVKFELRADSFNVLNHINWGNPDSTIDSGTAGQIIGTNVANSPRIWQLGGKLSF